MFDLQTCSPSRRIARTASLQSFDCQLVCRHLRVLGAAIVSLLYVMHGYGFQDEFKPLVTTTCGACHSNELLSQLDFNKLGHDLSDRATYTKWERIYDRLERGEMPPIPMPKPHPTLLEPAMVALKAALTDANLKARGEQRAPLRRLTKLEYQYTLQDLLQLDPGEAKIVSVVLPAEADSGGFDTVSARQGISELHVRGYMSAAQHALDMVLNAELPEYSTFHIDYTNSGYTKFIAEAEFLGGGVVKVVDDGAATFFDTASTYILNSQAEQIRIPTEGQYKITIDAYPYQAESMVVLTVFKGREGAAGSAALTDLLAEFDLTDKDGHTVELQTFLEPGDVIAPSVAEIELEPGAFRFFEGEHNVRDYQGEGIVLRTMTIEGPILDQQRRNRTSNLLGGIEFIDGEPVLDKSPEQHVRDVVASFLPRAFRRAVNDDEITTYANLAKPLLDVGRPFMDAVRLPLTAILTSPLFLFHANEGEELKDYGLASRLSYFLWRSMPDGELTGLAASGLLSDPEILSTQVERLLDHERHLRFVHDFVDQSFRLSEMQATTPDKGLYPEFDERLAKAMVNETELFLAELIDEDMSVSNLIEADFTFLNRRLAEHYLIEGIEKQHMRRVELPAGHERGGLLSQAAIHKITANGTTTSPVPRGNFVLANVLGQPAPPPPPTVAGLEPDTRGTTTIRAQLSAHRTNTVCASCHLSIDPPGFAMESFDPIGGFRSNYRVAGEDVVANGETYPGQYLLGLPVDASGITPEGIRFSGFKEYQKFLIDEKLKYVARHFVSELFVLATGADVEFVDRDAIYALVDDASAEGYPMRTMIREVATSDLFRRR